MKSIQFLLIFIVKSFSFVKSNTEENKKISTAASVLINRVAVYWFLVIIIIRSQFGGAEWGEVTL